MSRRRFHGLLLGGAALFSLPCLGVAAPMAAVAGCSGEVIDAVRESSLFERLHAGSDPQVVAASTCKAWPFDATKLLAEIAFSSGEASPGERLLDLRVAVLDAASATVLAGYAREEGEDSGFELAEDGLRLDTARYDLAPGVRAFGVVIHDTAGGPSCPDFSYENELRLFVQQERQLVPVLRQDLRAWRHVSGTPCSMGDTSAVSELAELVLVMGTQSHHGYRDIELKAKVLTMSSAPDTQRTVRIPMRYDGRRYRPASDTMAWLDRPYDRD